MELNVSSYLRQSHRATSEVPAVFLRCELGLLRLRSTLVAAVPFSPQSLPSLAWYLSIVVRSHAKRHGQFLDRFLKGSRWLCLVIADGLARANVRDPKSPPRRYLSLGFYQGLGCAGILCDGDWYCVLVMETFERKY